jgi:undecaprenyl-diphosphatase
VALAALGPALAITLTELVGKPLTDRGRGGHLLYPSGHMTALVAVITVAYVLLTTGKLTRYRVMTGLTWLAVTVVPATGLIGKREHFFTDTVGGVLVSVGAVLITATILDAVANRGVMKGDWWRQEVRHGSPPPTARGS